MDRFKVLGTLDAPGPKPQGLTYDGENVWVSDSKEDKVFKLDPETGQVLVTMPFDGEIAGTAWDGAHLWQADNRSKTVSQIDPETGKVGVSLEIDTGPGMLGGITFQREDLWVAISGMGQLRRIRIEDGAIAKCHPVEKTILGVGFDGRTLWYTEEGSNRLRRVDPATGTELMSYELDGTPTGLACLSRGSFLYCDAAEAKIHRIQLVARVSV